MIRSTRGEDISAACGQLLVMSKTEPKEAVAIETADHNPKHINSEP